VLVALASATAIAILMPAGPDDGCPTPRQVSAAVSAHLPGMVLPPGRAPGPGVLRLSVTWDAGNVLRVDLSDPDGAPLLRRRVAPEDPTGAKPGDCAALAETAALIVDRYWHEVGYEVPPAAPPAAPAPSPPPAPPPAPAPAAEPKPPAPPPAPAPPARAPPAPSPAPPAPPPGAPKLEPPPSEPAAEPPQPPSWWLGVGVTGAAADRGPRHVGASLAVAIERPAFGERLGLRFSVAAQNSDVVPWNGGKATVIQAPVAIDAYVAFPVGLGRLEPGLGADLDVILVTASLGNRSESYVRAAPGVDAALAWTIPIPHGFFFRLRAAGTAAMPYRVVNDALDHATILETPRYRAQVGLEFGFWFH
jgi:hypothetical protein